MQKFLTLLMAILILPCLLGFKIVGEEKSPSEKLPPEKLPCSTISDFKAVDKDSFSLITENEEVVRIVYNGEDFLVCTDDGLELEGVEYHGRERNDRCDGRKREDGFYVFEGSNQYYYCDITGKEQVEVGVPMRIHNTGYFIKANEIRFVDDATFHFMGKNSKNYLIRICPGPGYNEEAVGNWLNEFKLNTGNLSPEMAELAFLPKEDVYPIGCIEVRPNGIENVAPIRGEVEFPKGTFNITVKNVDIKVSRKRN